MTGEPKNRREDAPGNNPDARGSIEDFWPERDIQPSDLPLWTKAVCEAADELLDDKTPGTPSAVIRSVLFDLMGSNARKYSLMGVRLGIKYMVAPAEVFGPATEPAKVELAATGETGGAELEEALWVMHLQRLTLEADPPETPETHDSAPAAGSSQPPARRKP